MITYTAGDNHVAADDANGLVVLLIFHAIEEQQTPENVVESYTESHECCRKVKTQEIIVIIAVPWLEEFNFFRLHFHKINYCSDRHIIPHLTSNFYHFKIRHNHRLAFNAIVHPNNRDNCYRHHPS